MCCETNKHERTRAARFGRDCECGCCCGPAFRRFVSKKERLERLTEYREELQKEVEAVGEHIAELKKEE